MTFSVIECEQRSPAWFAARAGLLTATGAAAMLSKPKKGAEETLGRRDLRLRLALETLRGEPIDDDPFVSNDMKRGRALEPEAIGAYEARTGEIVQSVGFLRHIELPVGCSPDGIVGDYDGGLELKCPKYTTHDEYLKKGVVPSEYVAQVTHSLFVTGLPWWDFCSYCPYHIGAARLFRVRVLRDAVDLDAYALVFALFWREVEAEIEQQRALSATEVACEEAERRRSDLEEDERAGRVPLHLA